MYCSKCKLDRYTVDCTTDNSDYVVTICSVCSRALEYKLKKELRNDES